MLRTNLSQEYNCPHGSDSDINEPNLVHHGQKFYCHWCGGEHTAGVDVQVSTIRDWRDYPELPQSTEELQALIKEDDTPKTTDQELQALRKKVATYEARDALGLVPQPPGALGPDSKEWAKTAAGYAHVEAMRPCADGHHNTGPYWYGWALRGAFVAGAEWQEVRGVQAGKPSWDSHTWPQIVQDSSGNWFGVREGWTMSIVGNFKGDELNLLREDGEFLQRGTPSPNWRTSLEQRPAASLAQDYAPLTIAEARDLTCMLAGAPWPDEMLPELQQLLGIYDGLRAHGQRPVDPATLPRKVAKAVMKTGLLPATPQQPAPSAAPAVDEPDEVTKLRALAATCYAGLGAECNLPENWLDALNAAANGEPFTTAGLLPFKAEPSPQADSQPAPIDMVLHCPACGLQHIDGPESAVKTALDPNGVLCWTNPPHRSHLCHGCGHIWRPADVPTNGVAAVKTTGKADSVLEDAGLLDWQASARVEVSPEYEGPWHAAVFGEDEKPIFVASGNTPREALIAARKQGGA